MSKKDECTLLLEHKRATVKNKHILKVYKLSETKIENYMNQIEHYKITRGLDWIEYTSTKPK